MLRSLQPGAVLGRIHFDTVASSARRSTGWSRSSGWRWRCNAHATSRGSRRAPRPSPTRRARPGFALHAVHAAGRVRRWSTRCPCRRSWSWSTRRRSTPARRADPPAPAPRPLPGDRPPAAGRAVRRGYARAGTRRRGRRSRSRMTRAGARARARTPDPIPRDSAAAALFRTLAAAHLQRFDPRPPVPPQQPFTVADLSSLCAEALARADPMETFTARIALLVDRRDGAASYRPSRTPAVLDADRASRPRFPQPLAPTLAAMDQDLMLPGLDLVPPNTVVPLETNSPFVEAVLVGFNNELGRELVWREFPTPLQATYADRFWDPGVMQRPPDIPPLAEWGDRALGERNSLAGSAGPTSASSCCCAPSCCAATPTPSSTRSSRTSQRRAGDADPHRLDGARRALLRLRHRRRRDRRLVDRDRRAADGAPLRRRGRRRARLPPAPTTCRSPRATATPPSSPAACASSRCASRSPPPCC